MRQNRVGYFELLRNWVECDFDMRLGEVLVKNGGTRENGIE